MAYKTGTATNINDLFNKLADFLVDSQSGWTIDSKSTSGTKPSLYVHNSDGYWSLYSSNDTDVSIWGNIGYNASLAVDKQPGSSGTNHNSGTYYGAVTSKLAGPYISYDFFVTEHYAHIVIQISTGLFRHLGFGTLNKEGNYGGGQYAYGSWIPVESTYNGENCLPFADYVSHYNRYNSQYRATMIRAELETPAPDTFWYRFSASGLPCAGSQSIGLGCAGGLRSPSSGPHPDSILVAVSQNNYTQSITPAPNAIYVRTSEGLMRRLGTVPDFNVALIAGLVPRSIHEIAGEKWMFIPVIQLQSNTSGAPVGQGNSYNGGYAYRIIE